MNHKNNINHINHSSDNMLDKCTSKQVNRMKVNIEISKSISVNPQGRNVYNLYSLIAKAIRLKQPKRSIDRRRQFKPIMQWKVAQLIVNNKNKFLFNVKGNIMKKIQLLIGLIMSILISIPITMQSQSTCPNLDFSMANFTHWQPYLGFCGSGININPSSPTAGRHTIMDAQQLMMTGQMQDERCAAISKVPTGFNYIAKLGNENIGSEMEALEYTMRVDSSNSLLILHFAWVMEYPEHSLEDRPKFTITIKDSLGQAIDSSILPCGNINFVASRNLTNLICYISPSPSTGGFLARDWTTVGFNLEPLIGQRIKIYFETRDCTQSGHYGYAYIVGECKPMTIDLMYCEGESVAHFQAPDGFAYYQWTRSSHPGWTMAGTKQIVIADPIDGEEIICKVTSELDSNCSATLRTVIAQTSIDADFVYGVMENGGVDIGGHNYQNWYDTLSRTATFVDLSTVKNSKKESILWEIPSLGVMSWDSLFTYTFPFPETNEAVEYLIRLTVYAENGCIDTSQGRITHYITIYSSPRVRIAGVEQLCAGDSTYLKAIVSSSKFIEHRWHWQDSNNVIHTATGDSLLIDRPGTYFLTSIDSTGYFVRDTHVVTPLKPVMSVYITDVDCYGDATGGFMYSGITGGESPYQRYHWILLDANGNSYTEAGSLLGGMYTNLIAGKYIFEAIDARGCLIYDEIVIKQNDSLKIKATSTPAICGLDNGSLNLTVTGGVPPYTFEVRKTDNTLIDTTDIVSNLRVGIYRITVIDKVGCITSDTISVTSIPIYIPHVELYSDTFGTVQTEKGSVNIIQVNTCTNDTAIIMAIPNTDYRFVQWNDSNTNNPRSIIVTQDTVFIAKFEASTGIINLKTSTIAIYPNPAKDNIMVVLPENVHQAVFTFYDTQGKVLIRKEISSQDVVSVSNLAGGIYIYNIQTEKENYFGKLIIKN